VTDPAIKDIVPVLEPGNWSLIIVLIRMELLEFVAAVSGIAIGGRTGMGKHRKAALSNVTRREGLIIPAVLFSRLAKVVVLFPPVASTLMINP
jgi:hypothetical protein